MYYVCVWTTALNLVPADLNPSTGYWIVLFSIQGWGVSTRLVSSPLQLVHEFTPKQLLPMVWGDYPAWVESNHTDTSKHASCRGIRIFSSLFSQVTFHCPLDANPNANSNFPVQSIQQVPFSAARCRPRPPPKMSHPLQLQCTASGWLPANSQPARNCAGPNSSLRRSPKNTK